MDLQVKDNKGKIVGSVAASDQVWRAESNDALLHQVIVDEALPRQPTTMSL